MAKSKRGGKRDGAGRKNTGRVLVSMRLEPAIVDKAKRLGMGNLRDGVTLAVSAAR